MLTIEEREAVLASQYWGEDDLGRVGEDGKWQL